MKGNEQMNYKVLLFVDRLESGGIQTLLLNLISHFNDSPIKFDLLLLDDGVTYDLENTFAELGVGIYKLKGIWIDQPFDYISYSRALNHFYKEHHDYLAVHLHSTSKNFLVLRYAKKYGIGKRIAHSHNTDFQSDSFIKKFFGNIFRYPLKYYATDYFACSVLAANWMFGAKEFNRGHVTIFPNVIDTEKFSFNENIRREYRNLLGLEDKLVIGSIGRITYQKNHLFMLDIFKKIHDINSDSVLLLVGVGDLIEICRAKCDELGISDSVVFLGYRKDINQLLQAMDCLVMPSLYEGFPVTVVEAQASGIPVILSDSITKEVKLTPLVHYIELNQEPQIWAKEIIDSHIEKRVGWDTILREKGYDVRTAVKILENIYFNN